MANGGESEDETDRVTLTLGHSLGGATVWAATRGVFVNQLRINANFLRRDEADPIVEINLFLRSHAHSREGERQPPCPGGASERMC